MGETKAQYLDKENGVPKMAQGKAQKLWYEQLRTPVTNKFIEAHFCLASIFDFMPSNFPVCPHIIRWCAFLVFLFACDKLHISFDISGQRVLPVNIYVYIYLYGYVIFFMAL